MSSKISLAIASLVVAFGSVGCSSAWMSREEHERVDRETRLGPRADAARARHRPPCGDREGPGLYARATEHAQVPRLASSPSDPPEREPGCEEQGARSDEEQQVETSERQRTAALDVALDVATGAAVPALRRLLRERDGCHYEVRKHRACECR